MLKVSIENGSSHKKVRDFTYGDVIEVDGLSGTKGPVVVTYGTPYAYSLVLLSDMSNVWTASYLMDWPVTQYHGRFTIKD
jgi:hypothetical protein